MKYWIIVALFVFIIACQSSLPVANEETKDSENDSENDCEDTNEEGGVNNQTSEEMDMDVYQIDVYELNNVNPFYNIPVGGGWYTCPDSL